MASKQAPATKSLHKPIQFNSLLLFSRCRFRLCRLFCDCARHCAQRVVKPLLHLRGSIGQIPPTNDVVAVQYGAGLVARDLHGDVLLDTGEADVADG